MGKLQMTTRGAPMRESGLTLGPVIFHSRQPQFTAASAKACSSKLKDLHHNSCSEAPIFKVISTKHEHGWTIDGMNWTAQGEASVLKSIILYGTSTAQCVGQPLARGKEANSGAADWMWWTDRSHTDDG
jgi:hypothetical protein